MHEHAKNNQMSAVIAVYDVTRRETFTNLSDVWAKEVDLYCTNKDCVKMLVGNKVDIVCLNSLFNSVITWRTNISSNEVFTSIQIELIFNTSYFSRKSY